MLGLMDDELRSKPSNHEDSSAKSFTNQIKRVIDRQSARADAQDTPSSTKNQPKLARRRWWNKHPRLQDYVLPPRHRADHLLDCYWRLVNTLYPFLDPAGFQSTYQRLWTGEDPGEDAPTFLCLLNIVFAIACNLDAVIPAADRAHEADVFYRRGQEFLELDLIQNRSILTVQCFLLLGQYLQSTNDSQQCWIFVGLAIRVAQSLGLDLPHTTEPCPVHKAETLRRVWHGCVLMDRAISMTYGRSPMITLQAATMVPLPSPHLENGVGDSFDGVACPDEEPSPFFLETLKLYEIMAETLIDWYVSPLSSLGSNGELLTTDSGGLGAKAIGKILEMDRKLWSWRRNLPAHLQHGHIHRTRSVIHQRQSNVLWVRHHHIRLLLFRPLLARFCAIGETRPPSDERILPWKIILQCCITCVEIALDTISFLYDIMSEKPAKELDEMLPVWWYTIFYLYSAATVLVAARLSSDILAHISEDTIIGAWHKVLEMFKLLSSFSNHATRCAAALEALFDQVSEQPSGDRQFQYQQQSEERTMPSMPSPQQGWRIDRTRHPHYFSTVSKTTTAVDPWSDNVPRSAVPNDSIAAHTPGENGVTLDHPSYQNMINFSSSLELLDLPGIEIDLSRMAWLTSFPTEL